MTAPALRGVWAASLTPIADDGGIDRDRWAAHARRLLQSGCDGIGVFGTTGETQSFSVAERQAGLDALVAAGVPAERLIVGVGCNARADTVALARHALDHGSLRMLALPPFFYKDVGEEGLFRAFDEVLDAVADPRLELLLYHFPQVSGVPITTGLLDRLIAAHPRQIVGVKDSSGDLGHTVSLVERYPELAVFAGNDAHLLSVVEAGGAGTISAAANIASAQSRAVLDAVEAGDGLLAGTNMAVLKAVREVVQRYPLIPGLKRVLAVETGDPDWARVRPPLTELSEEQGVEMHRALREVGWSPRP